MSCSFFPRLDDDELRAVTQRRRISGTSAVCREADSFMATTGALLHTRAPVELCVGISVLGGSRFTGTLGLVREVSRPVVNGTLARMRALQCVLVQLVASPPRCGERASGKRSKRRGSAERLASVSEIGWFRQTIRIALGP